MLKEEFEEVFGGVNSPEYRGAPIPEPLPHSINESAFNDKLRYKEYNIDLNEDENIIYVNWTSQEWPDDGNVNDFLAELERCFIEIGFIGKVKVDIWMRGEKHSKKYRKQTHFTITNL